MGSDSAESGLFQMSSYRQVGEAEVAEKGKRCGRRRSIVENTLHSTCSVKRSHKYLFFVLVGFQQFQQLFFQSNFSFSESFSLLEPISNGDMSPRNPLKFLLPLLRGMATINFYSIFEKQRFHSAVLLFLLGYRYNSRIQWGFALIIANS